MADDDPVNHCPLCGNKVPPGVNKCPVCATELQSVFSRRSKQGLGPPSIDDYLHKELPRVSLPVPKMSCPLCGIGLDGGEAKCPRCGTPLVSQDEMLECPECGALSAPGAKACTKCGVGFDVQPSLPIVTPAPVAPPPSRPPPEPIIPKMKPVATAPAARGVSRPASMRPPEATTPAPIPASSRQGFANGRGAVNGTGLVNGTGMTNGTRAEGRPLPSPSRGKGSFITRWQFVAVLLAVVIIVPSFVFLSYVRHSGTIDIDGDFGDWKGVSMFSMETSPSAASINVDHWGVVLDGRNLWLYVSVQSGLMVSSGVDSFFLFVDSDSSGDTGYAVGGIGADLLLEVDGWNGSIQSTSISRYAGSSSEHLDWNSWESIGSLSAAMSSDKLECGTELPEAIPSTARLLLMSQNPFEQKAVSHSVPVKGGLLVVTQEVNEANAPNGIVPSGTSVQMVRLHLFADGASGTVSSISPSVVGAEPGPSISPITLANGEERLVDLSVDTSLSPSGTLVTVSVLTGGVVSDFASVSVRGAPVMAYAISAPSGIVIDGAFGDWVGRTAADTDSTPPPNPDVDVTATGAVNTTLSSSFYVAVRGTICNGTFVPALRMRPSGSGGGSGTVLPRITGEDVLKIYIDNDLNGSTGQALSGAGKVIGADRMIEVRGLNGRVVSTTFKTFQSNAWSTMPAAILAANDDSRLEVSVPAAAVGDNTSIDFIIETTDWRGRTDLATATPAGARALSSGLTAGILSWPISSSTSQTATAMSYQRKLFYDGTNFWSFYSDGANTVCRYSTDGITWSASSRVFSNAGILEASIWYDGSNQAVYAVGDKSGGSRNVYVQKGTVTPATHAIAWESKDVTVSVSVMNLGSKNSFISRDANGYIWVLSSNCSQAPPTMYNISAFRSLLPNSIAGWSYSGSLLSSLTTQVNVQGSILPVGTGSDMWAVYCWAGNVAARKFSGTWGAQQTLFTTTGPIGHTDVAPASAVVDPSGVLHVVFGNDHEHPAGIPMPHIGYSRNNGSAWSPINYISGTPTNDGFTYPTLTIDSTTRLLYAFWVRISDQNIIGMCNYSVFVEIWTSLLLGAQTTYAKQYLTSIYSAPGEQFLCWQWTQNTTAPIQVQFDMIPEFDELSLPVGFLCIALVFIGRRSLRKES